jgi:branched-chain amino acid transport system ATP-binding protein
MTKPRLLLCDELSLGLAPKIVAALFDLIAVLNKTGLTIILIEQNVRRSLSICQRAYVLENGRIVIEGTGAELLNHPHVKQAYLGV